MHIGYKYISQYRVSIKYPSTKDASSIIIMDYTTCMTVIIICLFAMGCLCCIWVICCGIALMETKYATTLENLAQNTAKNNGSQIYQCSCHNTNYSFKEKLNSSEDSFIKIKPNGIQSTKSREDCPLTLIPLSISNIDLDNQLLEVKSNMIS